MGMKHDFPASSLTDWHQTPDTMPSLPWWMPSDLNCKRKYTLSSLTCFFSDYFIYLFIYFYHSNRKQTNPGIFISHSFMIIDVESLFMVFHFLPHCGFCHCHPEWQKFPIAPLSCASPPLAWVPVSEVFFFTYMLLNTLFYISDKQYPTTLPSYSADLNTCCIWEPIKKLLKTCQAQVHLKVLN